MGDIDHTPVSAPCRRLTPVLAIVLIGSLPLAAIADVRPDRGGEDIAVDRAESEAASITLTRQTLLDPGMRNMASHTLLVPKGWGLEGQAFWGGQGAFRWLPSPTFTATAPDGSEVSLAPQMSFKDIAISRLGTQWGMRRPQEGQSANGYPVLTMPPDEDAWRQWIEKLIREGNPDWSDVSVSSPIDVPEVTDALQQQIAPLRPVFEQMNRQNRQMDMQMQQMGAPAMQQHMSVGARAMGFDFVYTLSGVEMSGAALIGLNLVTSESNLSREVLWSMAPTLSFTAPEGRLEERVPLLMSIASSVQQTPEWNRMLVDHIAKMNGIDRDGAREMARINANHAREMSRINRQAADSNMESWRRRQEVQDDGARKFNNALTGVEDYSSAGENTGIGSDSTVSLPGGYDRVYTNGTGDYIMTNDPFYDPGTDPGVNSQNWDRMRSHD